MRVVYLPENASEAQKRFWTDTFPDDDFEFIEVPGMNIPCDNSLSVQHYLAQRGLNELIRPVEFKL